jgi:hypothetical protein
MPAHELAPALILAVSPLVFAHPYLGCEPPHEPLMALSGPA